MADKTQPVDRETRRATALKFTEDGRPATLAELGDARRELSRNERIKLERGGFTVWEDIVKRYAKEGYESIEDDDLERFKWYGIYRQRPNTGHFMMRLKVPGGAVSAVQLYEIAAMSHAHARGFADITTRQDFQVHWLTIEVIPEVVEGLQSVGLTTKGACGDVARNICSSPLAGIDPDEVLNPLPLVMEATNLFAGNPEYADLPRKHKMLVVGNPASGQIEIQEIALYGMRRSDDAAIGYHCRIGGGLSTEPHLGQNLGAFIPPEQALAVLEAITAIYRDHGYRKSRKHARLKYLVADWGAAKFRARVEEYLGYKLRDAEPENDDVPGYQDRLGVHPQPQAGLSFIGVTVVAGRITSDQIEEVAKLSEEFGTGEVRLTVMQNFYLINIPNEKVEAVLARLDAIGLPVESSPVTRGVIACTGIQFCNLAVTETKERAQNLVQVLEGKVNWRESEFFRINVNGCPNSCGQHWIADVGLQGCTKKVDGQLVEHFDVFLGGSLGGKAAFNRRIKRLPAEEVPNAMQRVIEHYQARREGNETFADFCSRHSEEELEAML
ncbi:MAG TPA: nitrite/sulfite reductase [Abditibacteriaceae bacterium]|nr:nitrite/sulfite reductase [Abditibacteriaceae bacterium]